ncbi:hypothetical protein AVEN_115044-1 [Araneus ventricosus]|uniref:Transposase Tc1-like domain-containing protein n=1 Tax=Araneus ventricosus TaxID=182803 RepID=A0A4Y1ZWZ3_ARAVE|nr:hypothetical protein AVEN_115044-1 [Araneus ventricosus]
MEIDLTQADADRKLNVSCSVVQKLRDQFQSENSDWRRPVQDSRRVTNFAEDNFIALLARRRRTTTVPWPVSDHFGEEGTRISATTMRRRLYIQELYARRTLLCAYKRSHTWNRQKWVSILFTMSPDLIWSVNQALC